MEKYNAIPPGYMTVGELAKKMNTSVRTLQYYDKEGVLKPSGESEGGRRLYAEKDILKLHQIQSMKLLNFSLDDIKNKLAALHTPEDFAEMLTQQAKTIRTSIAFLLKTLSVIEIVKQECLQMDNIDFVKYADIVLLLQAEKNDFWVMKYFDERLWTYLWKNYSLEEAQAMLQAWKQPPDEQAWWDLVYAFTGGDVSYLNGLEKHPKMNETEQQEIRHTATAYIQKILTVYVQVLSLIQGE